MLVWGEYWIPWQLACLVLENHAVYDTRATT